MSRKTALLYSVHPSVEYAKAIVEKLPSKTGRSIDAWIEVLRRDGPVPAKAQTAWLKNTHGLGGTTAGLIVDLATGKNLERVDADAYLRAATGYVDAMYAGPKAALRPIHDALVALAYDMGPDVKISPCRTIVPWYRHHVFAEIKPSTRTRVDFGLALRGAVPEPIQRLQSTGGLEKGDRITHRFAITAVDQVDAQVTRWTRIAYELDG